MGARQPHPAVADPARLRGAFHEFAQILEMIGEAWIDADGKKLGLLAAGAQPSGGSFEVQVREVFLEPVSQLLRKLRSDLVPFVLPHCDPSLRDRIQRVLRLLDLRAVVRDTYGEERERWRHNWAVTGLGEEFEELGPMLSARGDALVIERRPDAAELPWQGMSDDEKKRVVQECAAAAATRKALYEAVDQRCAKTTPGAVKKWVQRAVERDSSFGRAVSANIATTKRAGQVSPSRSK